MKEKEKERERKGGREKEENIYKNIILNFFGGQIWNPSAWVWILASPLTSCVNLI